ncbi:helix-turn-helix transcriptional regulator [Aestuariivivens sp. NBU2969]|uniref:helix-turn-helix transcriptional regulator n=1 Tax=Aestuariivivens sp. NBU2969 TaxID=2873267 RepID=UPI001CBEFD27|nr:helix-turn-helix transcriptional regulator [Aestuariivivens sp. NBU2969]
MVNSKEFAIRLQKIMDYYSESASSFAEKIGVQRSSISHILSERNKPSLEFVLKIVSSFPEVELYWLLNGKGIFPVDSETNNQNFSVISKQTASYVEDKSQSTKNIERIVIFYTDGTFKNFKN